MNAVFAWLLDRAKEPSTWAGTGLVATAIHSLIPGTIGDNVIGWLQVTAGLVAAFAAEKKAA